MGINWGILQGIENGRQSGEIEADLDKRQQGQLLREFMMQQQAQEAAENRENAQATYYQNRNDTMAKEYTDRLAAAKAQQETEAQQKQAALTETIRHNKADEANAQSRTQAEILFHKLALRGDPLQKQVSDFVKARYDELLKSPGKDIMGQPLPAMAATDAAQQARSEARAMYGPMVDQVIPPTPKPASPQQPQGAPPNPTAVSGYQKDLQQAMQLHQQAIAAGIPVPKADSALAQVNLNLHQQYGLPTPPARGITPAPGALATTPVTPSQSPAVGMPSAASPPAQPAVAPMVKPTIVPQPDDDIDEDSQ